MDAVWGDPHENPGRRHKDRARVLGCGIRMKTPGTVPMTGTRRDCKFTDNDGRTKKIIINHQSCITNCTSQFTNHKSQIINHKSYVINDKIISHQSSIIILAQARQFDSSVLPNPSRRDVLELANLVLGSHGVLQIREPMLATALPVCAPERRTACATMGRVVDFPRHQKSQITNHKSHCSHHLCVLRLTVFSEGVNETNVLCSRRALRSCGPRL